VTPPRIVYSLELLFNNTWRVFCVFEFENLSELATKLEKCSYFEGWESFKEQRTEKKMSLCQIYWRKSHFRVYCVGIQYILKIHYSIPVSVKRGEVSKVAGTLHYVPSFLLTKRTIGQGPVPML
jgi:hypothetical protein